MGRLIASLPGAPFVRIVLGVLLVVLVLAGLVVFYEWLGGVLLDSGGTVG